jgi:large subunit ribosomal protein L17
MRHRNTLKKLGRTATHRRSLISNMIVSLIEHKRIRTTLGKAKALRPFAEKIITLGKKGVKANATREDATKDTPQALHYRRLAISRLKQNQGAVKHLFDVVAPIILEREGGYLRITKLGQRRSDSAPMAYIEFVDREKMGSAPADASPAHVEEEAPGELVVDVSDSDDTEVKPKATKKAAKKAATKKAKTEE